MDGSLSPTDLMQSKDVIEIQVLDEFPVSSVNAEEHRARTVCDREYRLLGTLEIAVSSVCRTGKIDGELRIATPPVLLAYCQSAKPAAVSLSIQLTPPLSESAKTEGIAQRVIPDAEDSWQK